MRRNTFITLVGMIVAFVLLMLFVTLKSGDQTAQILTLREKALQKQDMARSKIIESAAAIYESEHGFSPESLDDLVAGGYLMEEDTLDHNGQPMPYTPEQPRSGSGSMAGYKRCGKCGGVVSNSAQPGDTCPHCGVTWGGERVSYGD